MELGDFLTQQCKDRKTSLRSMSVNAGLSPGTVYNIVKNRCRPSVSSLNALANYLGVRREYLWHMAGLLEDRDYSTKISTLIDPQLEHLCDQVNHLPKEKKSFLLSVIKALIINLKSEDGTVQTRSIGAAKASKGRRKYRTRASKK